jgi:hypothetical protein
MIVFACALFSAIRVGPAPAQGGIDQATAIITAAIARKNALLAPLDDYQYQSAVRFVARDLDKPPDSTSSLAMISETRSTVYWQPPQHYREVIMARRKANHLTPVWNTLSVADIGNFQRERVDIAPHSFVSPIADDAFAYYRYQVQDTVIVNGRRAFRLAIMPRSQTAPAFAGTIEILDSTFDVTAIDVGVNDAARFGLWRMIRYQERFADVGGGRWMPVEIRMTGEARLPLPIPRTPRRLALEQEAQFSDFQFIPSEHSGDLNEVRIAVDDQADHAGDSAWSAPGAIPLTDAERQTWAHVDSTTRGRPGLIGRARQASAVGDWVAASPDFFHFNRVDGAYVGAGWTWRQTPVLNLTTKLGYATGSDRWQYRVGGDFEVATAERTWIGASYHDETVSRPSLVGHTTDRTIQALLYRQDPLDYYGERGLTLSFVTRPLDFTRLEFYYNDQEQTNLPVATDFSLLPSHRAPRDNGPITAGRMRSLSGIFTWDSRSLLRRNGHDSRLASLTWTRVTLNAEVATPSLIPNDFNFGRYVFQIERHQRTLRSGITTINLLAGIGTGTVPPQRYFAIEAGVRALGFEGGGFNTIGDTSFAGNRVAMLSVRHDFDRLLFAESGLPVLRRLPFTFSIYAAAFAIGFAYHDPVPGDSAFRTTAVPYTEAGFIVGHLMPFLAPLTVGAQFTWQLSSQAQATRRFQFGLNLTGP